MYLNIYYMKWWNPIECHCEILWCIIISWNFSKIFICFHWILKWNRNISLYMKIQWKQMKILKKFQLIMMRRCIPQWHSPGFHLLINRNLAIEAFSLFSLLLFIYQQTIEFSLTLDEVQPDVTMKYFNES